MLSLIILIFVIKINNKMNWILNQLEDEKRGLTTLLFLFILCYLSIVLRKDMDKNIHNALNLSTHIKS